MVLTALDKETRSINTGPLRVFNISDIAIGAPSLSSHRPLGVVFVFCPTRLVGDICPPVIP